MLSVPRARDPLLSVVMVTYGGWDWPLRALEALREHTDVPFEAICVDNASWDGTGDLLEELVGGPIVVRNLDNRGFAGAANQGARLARGEVLCFLNPDCLVLPGWLPPLLRALERPGAGAAIPRFFDEEGRVDEAGSVVDSQGWTEALGRGAGARDPEHRFPRVIDYGSAACLVMRRTTFEAAGGFDEAYHPAYCEDVDLAFRLRAAGLRTWYEPRSSVLHAGTVSTSTTVRDRLIERNRRRLLERWGDDLADRPSLTEIGRRQGLLVALRDAAAPDRLLVAVDRLPEAAEPFHRFVTEAAAVADGRVTVLTRSGGADAVTLLDAGAEVAVSEDVARWLSSRPFHYSAVVAGDDALDEALQRWQPQAERRPLEDAAGESGTAFMASLGVVPAL